jgi:hypothetical protein
MVVSVGNICNINDLPLSRISLSFSDYPLIFLKPNAVVNFSTTAIFSPFYKVSSNTRETCLYVLPNLFNVYSS